MPNFGSLTPGAKDAKSRAEAVLKRRNVATAMVTDLDLELEDLKVSLQLEQKDYQPGDLVKFKTAVERAQTIMGLIYDDVNQIADNPVPERINEGQVYELLQPVMRIESRARETRSWFEKANKARQELAAPREKAAGQLVEAEQRRLQAEISLAAARSMAARLKADYSESYPRVEQALITATSETQAATQMVSAARQEISEKGWSKSLDLSRRAMTLFESATAKFELIKSSEGEQAEAAQEADDNVAAALRRLKEAQSYLKTQAALLAAPPDYYLGAAVQRLGEARQAYKATPPLHITAMRLAKEAISLIEQAQRQANEEIHKIQDNRNEARQSLSKLVEAVQNLRISLNAQRTVPVKANKLYEQARNERDRLSPRETEIDYLALPQLVELTAALKTALQIAQDGLKLLGN